jgi:hypothetical protein
LDILLSRIWMEATLMVLVRARRIHPCAHIKMYEVYKLPTMKLIIQLIIQLSTCGRYGCESRGHEPD